MSCCGDNKKFNCGERISSKCVFYSKYFPEYTNLEDHECTTIEETAEDTYKLIDWIKESIDLEDYDPKCVDDVEKVEDVYFKNKNRYLVKNVVQSLTEKVCELEESFNTPNGNNQIDILANLDYKCLTGLCDPKPGSLQELFQILINEICELKNTNPNPE